MTVIHEARTHGVAAFERARRGPLARNLVADVGVAMGMGLTTALVWTLLPSIARRSGVDVLGLAMLTAAPFVANVLSVFAGRVGPHTPRGLAVVRGLGGLLLLSLVLAPNAPVMALLAVGFWLTISFGVPLQIRLWGQMYPQERRGRLVGLVGMGRAAAAGIGVLLGGALADQIGGLQAIAIGGVVGLLLGASALRIRTDDPAPSRTFAARESLAVLRADPILRRATLAQGFLGAGLIAAGPLLAFVQVDRLSLSLADVGLLGLSAAIATTASYAPFGLLIDRRGGMATLRLGAVFGVTGLLVYSVAPAMLVLVVAAISLGLSSAAVEMGVQAVVGERSALDQRSAAMAGWNAATGLRGIVAPFTATGLIALGVIGVTTGLLLAAAVSFIGLILFWRTPTAREAPQRVAAADAATSTRVAAPDPAPAA